MKPTTSNSASSDPVQATFGFWGPDARPIAAPSGDARKDDLMPYEKVAKAIYVRANGLPAYRRATGHIHRSGDTGECESI